MLEGMVEHDKVPLSGDLSDSLLENGRPVRVCELRRNEEVDP
jgi:hypothetical protein